MKAAVLEAFRTRPTLWTAGSRYMAACSNLSVKVEKDLRFDRTRQTMRKKRAYLKVETRGQYKSGNTRAISGEEIQGNTSSHHRMMTDEMCQIWRKVGDAVKQT
jgi:hypothetical protein